MRFSGIGLDLEELSIRRMRPVCRGFAGGGSVALAWGFPVGPMLLNYVLPHRRRVAQLVRALP
jgi:hypothetical protein